MSYIVGIGITMLVNEPVSDPLAAELTVLQLEDKLRVLICYKDHYLQLNSLPHTLTEEDLNVLTLTADEMHHFKGLLRRLPYDKYMSLNDDFSFQVLKREVPQIAKAPQKTVIRPMKTIVRPKLTNQ